MMRLAAGEYNCFLNVIIQCLWHLGEFRHQLQRMVPNWWEYREKHAVVAALLRLFGDLQHAEQQLMANPHSQRCVQ